MSAKTSNNSTTSAENFILASSSLYRQQLLQKILPNFAAIAPEIDETRLSNETAKQMVVRLSIEKAKEIAKSKPNAIIIASDQTAEIDGQTLGKPGDFASAVAQLKQQSGKLINFHTGLAVFEPKTQQIHTAIDLTQVHFRKLNQQMIEDYLNLEQPFNCAGSFKSEGAGIILFNEIKTSDPNALIGLPLIKLTDLLLTIGVKLPILPKNQ